MVHFFIQNKLKKSRKDKNDIKFEYLEPIDEYAVTTIANLLFFPTIININICLKQEHYFSIYHSQLACKVGS